VEDLVKGGLQATAEILKVNISYFLNEDFTSEEIFDLYSGEKNIFYMALIDDKKEILGWHSRFEGFLPLSLQALGKKESWIIDSPAGKIFNLFSPFSSSEGKSYYLYLGYSLENLEEMIVHSRRSFLIVFGFLILIGIIFFMGLYRLQSHYLAKEKEAEQEKLEKMQFREISAFSSGIAHEIKNPLNRLSLLFELLHKTLPEKHEENVSIGRKEIQNISRIVDQFSSSLKPLKLNKEKFLLEEMVSDIRESLQKEIDQKKVTIQYTQTCPVLLNADKGLLSQALYNVLNNSLEAIDEGDINIEAKQHRKISSIIIKDSGKGISKDDQEHIFDPFFSKKEKGMGIGLYLTKKIIEAHKGKIDIQSRPGYGTTFHIQIPGG